MNISASNTPEAKIVSWREIKLLIQHLKCRYEDYPFAGIEKGDPGLPDAKFLLYNGNTILDELDLDIGDCMGIVVVGDLHVKGSIINENTDGASSLIVLGNLKAKNVCVGGQIIYIDGDITVEELLLGIYNHGELYSTSKVSCPVVISDDYHFNFPEHANVRVLELYDEDDNDLIKEKLIDDFFEEEEFLPFSTIREGMPLLRAPVVYTTITQEDITAIIDAPLLGPDNYKVAFSEDGWHITLNRGGEIDADGEASPSSVIAVNIDENKYYSWYISGDDAITTLIKDGEDWVPAPPEAKTDILQHFSIINTIINRKVRWNNRYVQNINQEELWKLVWMFRNDQEEEITFQASAIAICRRVLYAAAYPFAYVFARYQEASEHRGLAQYASWAPAAALLDGLIQWGLAQEITRQKPLAEKAEELDTVTDYNWGLTCQIPERYNTQPIDRDFLIELNETLASQEGAVLRLDAGIGSFIIAGMHINDLGILNELMHPLGIYPKYFISVDEDDEDALKEIADALLTTARDQDPMDLQPYREQQEALWNYIYNERGDIVFWQNWIKNLQSKLINRAGSSYIFRGDNEVAPMHPELNHWINWCEKYETVSEGSHIIMPA